MGLFGGFKAKFTRNSKSKESVTQTSVVPLNFKLQSEFDIPNTSTELSNGIKPVANRKITKPRPPIRSATFENNNKALLEKLKSRSLINLSEKPSIAESTDTYEYDKPNVKKSNSVKETVNISQEYEYEKPNSMYRGSFRTVKKTSSLKATNAISQVEDELGNYIYTGPTGSIHHYEQIKSIDEDPDSYEDETASTLILMTQRAPDDTKLKSSTTLEMPKSDRNMFGEEEEYTVNSMEVYAPEMANDEEEFKVNIMHHSKNYVSEDELSYMEDETPSDFGGYSSQATSIFFGNSPALPPPPIRPRMMNLKKNDDSDDEEDC